MLTPAMGPGPSGPSLTAAPNYSDSSDIDEEKRHTIEGSSTESDVVRLDDSESDVVGDSDDSGSTGIKDSDGSESTDRGPAVAQQDDSSSSYGAAEERDKVTDLPLTSRQDRVPTGLTNDSDAPPRFDARLMGMSAPSESQASSDRYLSAGSQGDDSRNASPMHQQPRVERNASMILQRTLSLQQFEEMDLEVGQRVSLKVQLGSGRPTGSMGTIKQITDDNKVKVRWDDRKIQSFPYGAFLMKLRIIRDDDVSDSGSSEIGL